MTHLMTTTQTSRTLKKTMIEANPVTPNSDLIFSMDATIKINNRRIIL